MIVEDVVTALTGDVASGPGARAAIRSRMQRAADEFNERTAEAFARALLDSLTQNPTDLRQIEALIILGIAHPGILERHRISLDHEAERLLFLLERAGETERAETMREVLADRLTIEEVPDTEAPQAAPKADRQELIERHLRQADEAAQSGRTKEAIACLREVLALEPGRRDVTRLLRDLRQAQKDRKKRLGRGLKTMLVVIALGAAAYGVWMREESVRSRYLDIPPAKGDDPASLRARASAIEDLIASERFWFSMKDALEDKGRIEAQLRRRTEESEKERHEAAMVLEERVQNADAARVRGLMYAQQGKFDLALADFRQALELAPKGWEHRKRVQADLAAIEAFKAQPKRAGENSR